jgi:DNA-damage-inducible protein D
VIEILVGGARPRKYWSDLKKKLISEGYVEVSEKIGQLKLPAPDGKLRETDCAETETIFRNKGRCQILHYPHAAKIQNLIPQLYS